MHQLCGRLLFCGGCYRLHDVCGWLLLSLCFLNVYFVCCIWEVQCRGFLCLHFRMPRWNACEWRGLRRLRMGLV